MAPWLAAVPSILIAAGVLLLPGLAVTSAGGARGLRRWALAVPATFTLAGAAAIVLALTGLPFTAFSFVVVTVCAVVAVLAARYVLARVGRLPSRRLGAASEDTLAGAVAAGRRATTLALGFGLLFAAVAIGGRIMTGIGSPTAIAQLFDNVFHLNAVAIIHATGSGSSLSLGNLTEASRMFYPAAFHDVTALVMGFGVNDVSVAINAVSLVMSAVVWPLSLLFLATRLFGTRPPVLVLTGVLAASFSAFPYRMLSFGVLYPFHAAVAMLPVLIALAVEFSGMSRSRPVPAWGAALALAVAVPGVALAHPSVVTAALLFAAPFVAARLIRELSARSPRAGRGAAIGLTSAYLVGTLCVFLVVRPPLSSAPWKPSHTYQEAIGSIVTLSAVPAAVAWGVFLLVLAGLAVLARRPALLWPVAAQFALGGLLFFASASVGNELARDLLTGVWYRDTERISALLVVAAFPLVLAGALAVHELARGLAARVRPQARNASTVALAIVALVLIVLTQRGPVPQAQNWIAQSFGQEGAQSLLSDDERALLATVPEFVPADGVIVGNPRTGASLTPAFAGRAALAPHIFGERTADEQFLLDHWDEAGTDPRVCEVVRDLGAYWALDFGVDDVTGAVDDLPGTDALGTASGIVELSRVGEAALYEAAACDPPTR